MRIAWATPFNIQSAIARYALEVVVELRRRGIDVTIVRSEIGAPAQLPAWSDDVPVLAPGQHDIGRIADSFDLSIVTIADHYAFNAGSVEIMRRIPSVGIFHDADIRHLAVGLVEHGMADQSTIDRLRRVGTKGMDPLPTGEDLAWFATLCIGTVSHGSHYAATLRANCPGPSLLLPLCYPEGQRIARIRPSGQFGIVISGVINPNKQADRVMRAIADSTKLKTRCVLDLVGQVEEKHRGQLTSLAAELGIATPNFHGWVSDARMQEMLAGANVICCLRYPVLEGGSASFISSLYSGTPIVLPNAGAYAEVPEDLVWQVTYGTEAGDVTRALEAIAENGAEADARAQRAAEWARQTYSASAYVDKLLPFLHQCMGIAPVIQAGRQLGATLQEIGASLDEPAAGRIGGVLEDLFMAERKGRT